MNRIKKAVRSALFLLSFIMVLPLILVGMQIHRIKQWYNYDD